VLPGSAKDKERWRLGKKHDLSELVESELRQLLTDYPLNLEEINKVGIAIKKQQQKQKEKGDANGVSSSYSSQDLDSPRTQLALRLNTASKDLAKIRFSLVPSRLKEPIFWDATIYLVKERLAQYNESCQSGGATPNIEPIVVETRGRPSKAEVSRQLKFPVQEETTTKKVPPNGNGKSIYKMEKQLAMKDAEIAELKQQLKEVQETLLDVAKLPSAPPFATARTNGASKKCKHQGQWQMDKDSVEFLAYPPEVKEAMRTEKQKRLRQVQKEMKFILDSDNIEDTHGKWDCCEKTDYNAECTRASF